MCALTSFCALAALNVWLVVATTVNAHGQISNDESGSQRSAKAIAEEVVDQGHTVCDAIFLKNQQPLAIVASVDASGRRFCNSLLLIAAAGRPRILQNIAAWKVEELSILHTDVDQDGTTELVVPTAISDYEGASCVAVVPIIYACSSEVCGQKDQRFADYYAERLMETEKEVSTADADSLPCLLMRRDKILRISGTNPIAGFEQAEAWMKVGDPSLRRKAIAVFADINDSQSRTRLQVLASDTDSRVAARARAALQRP